MPPVVTPRGPRGALGRWPGGELGQCLAGGQAVSSASAWPVALAVCWPVAWQCARPVAPQCARPVARRWASAPTKFALSEHRAGRQLAVPISRHSAALGRPGLTLRHDTPALGQHPAPALATALAGLGCW